MFKSTLLILMLTSTVVAQAKEMYVDFITINGESVVQIEKNDRVYQVVISKEDLAAKSPSDIVKDVCQRTKLCQYK